MAFSFTVIISSTLPLATRFSSVFERRHGNEWRLLLFNACELVEGENSRTYVKRSFKGTLNDDKEW
jgi:hypothetical protein